MKKLFLLILIFPVLAGCTTTKYIPVGTFQRDSVYITNIIRDTTAIRDSIYVEHKGDTLTVERWRTEYKAHYIHDTISVFRVDSVQVPYPVEKQLTTWEQLKTFATGLVFLAIIVLFIIIVIRMVRGFVKK